LGNFAFNPATSLLAKSQQKAWKRGEEGGRQVKGEGAVVMLVILGEKEMGGWCEGWGRVVVGGGGEGRWW